MRFLFFGKKKTKRNWCSFQVLLLYSKPLVLLTGVSIVLVSKEREGELLEKELNLRSADMNVKTGRAIMSQRNKHLHGSAIVESPCLINVYDALVKPFSLSPTLLCSHIYHIQEQDLRDYIVHFSHCLEKIKVQIVELIFLWLYGMLEESWDQKNGLIIPRSGIFSLYCATFLVLLFKEAWKRLNSSF